MASQDELIALFLPSLAGGGAERMAVNLVASLLESGASVDLVVCRREGPLTAEIPKGAEVVDLGASAVSRAIFPLARYLRTRQPNVLLSVMSHANAAAILARGLARSHTRLAVVEQQHLTMGARYGGTRRNRAMPLIARFLYPRADAVVAVAEGVAADLHERARVRLDKLRVIHNPIDFPEIRRRGEEEPSHAWFGNGAPPVVLSAGRLAEQKDFPTLLEAFARARSRIDARLIILGDGPDRDDLERLVTSLGLDGQVDLVPYQDNPYAFMRRAAVFALSSKWEGLPTVLLEAAGLGTPLVSADCPGGPRDIVGDSSHLLVPPGDARALGDAVVNAISEPERYRFELDETAYERGQVAREYLDLLLPTIRLT
jgi:glycosyltransferase involved in cell wall biosynthesis